MAELLYKTLGGVSPRGKARVYFACHPQDHKGYFQEITDEILKLCDCAIYYYVETPELDEDYYANLNRMQLIVMPVTTRLLYMTNRAMDVEFPYAQERHIPVLPLMQEQGLEQQYQEKFGDLQFLDKGNRDLTAIPYEEKLKKYLNAVLLSDELTALVRAAFDAWIFLSYRKKDRKAAQELMKLIHSDPRCRDIAIWYDEFLNPGEDFNDAILKALQESDLFVMAVTPNLVGETNYVMTEEYPKACDAGKQILPAEMEKTDWDALHKGFPGVPDPLDPSADGAVTGAVLDALGALAIRENDEDPKHNFFIGLAYLSGLFVEKDHPWAVKLITQAAEAGLTEAMEKLVTMYESGEGVEQSYPNAIFWREKLVVYARQQYETSHEESDGCRYYHRVDELRQANSEIQYIDRALELCDEMKAIASQLMQQFNTGKTKWLLMKAYKTAGDTFFAEKRYQEARDQYSEEVRLAEAMYRDDPQAEIKRALASAYGNLAVAYREIGRGSVYKKGEELTAAEKWFRKAQTYIEELAQEDETPETREALAHIYLDMVELFDMCILLDEKWPHMSAKEKDDYSGKAVSILENLVKEYGTDKYKEILCRCYAQVSRHELGSSSLRWLQKYLEIAEAECLRSEKIPFHRHLVNGCYMLAARWIDRCAGKSNQKSGSIHEAERYLVQGIVAARKLAAQTHAERDKLMLADLLIKTGELFWRAGALKDRLSGGETVLHEAEKIVLDLMKDNDSTALRVKLAEILRMQARLAEKAGRAAWAEYKFRKAIQILDATLEKEKPEEVLDLAAAICINLLELLRDTDQKNEAGFWFHRAWEYEQMMDLSGSALTSLEVLFLHDEPQVPADTRPPVPLEQDAELYSRMMNELFPSECDDILLSLDDLFS